MEKVNADLRWWLERVGPYQYFLRNNYRKVADSVLKKLGKEGVASIFNARGPNAKGPNGEELGGDYRWEMFVDSAKKEKGVRMLEGGSVLVDESKDKEISFVKGQELKGDYNSSGKNIRIVYGVYGLPYSKNLNENKEALPNILEAKERGLPVVLNAVSCAGSFEKLLKNEDEFLKNFDGVIIHLGSKWKNKYSARVYSENTGYFEDILLGCLAASGGYSPYSVGSSSTRMKALRTDCLENYLVDLKRGMSLAGIDDLERGKIPSIENAVHAFRMAKDGIPLINKL